MSSSIARTVQRVMNRIAPLALAEPWDNVGLLLEAPKTWHESSQILLTIDLTPSVLNEALSSIPPTSCIIAYHPPIFKPITSFTLANPLQSSLLRCAAAGVSIYSPHTALDSVNGGINDWLALGLLHPDEGRVKILERKARELDGDITSSSDGLGRIVEFTKPENGIAIELLIDRIKSFLKLKHVQVASPDLSLLKIEKHVPIKSIALCAGSGASVLNNVDADMYFTGEMQHHDVLAAVAKGRHVVLCGHTNTERGYLPILSQTLRDGLAQDPESNGQFHHDVVVSRADAHPLKIA